jgi:hypothetical protein
MVSLADMYMYDQQLLNSTGCGILLMENTTNTQGIFSAISSLKFANFFNITTFRFSS